MQTQKFGTGGLPAPLIEIIASTESDFEEVTRNISKATKKSFSIEVDWQGLIAGVRALAGNTDHEACAMVCKALADYKLRCELCEGIWKLLGFGCDPRFLREHKNEIQRHQECFEAFVKVPKIRIVPSDKDSADSLFVVEGALQWAVSCPALVAGRHKEDAVNAKFWQDVANYFGQAVTPGAQSAGAANPAARPEGSQALSLGQVVGYSNGHISRFDRARLQAALRQPNLLIDTPIDDQGNTALHFYCRVPLPAGIEMLIERGANPNALNKKGETPFHRIAEQGMMYSTEVQHRTEDWLVEAASILIASGRLDPNIRANGDTALHRALHLRYFDLAETIVKGCKTLDLSAADQSGSTALDLAIRAGANKLVRAIEQAASTKATGAPSKEQAVASTEGGSTDKDLARVVVLMADMLAAMAERSGDKRVASLRTMVYDVKKKYGM